MNKKEVMCSECNLAATEEDGRWTIIGEKRDGFEWIFLCIICIREWRQRGLKRTGMSSKELQKQLDLEYPLPKHFQNLSN